MDTRMKFVESLKGISGVSPPKWEYAYWGATLNRWYNEGLPNKHQPSFSETSTSISSSVYSFAWNFNWSTKNNPPGSSKNKESPDCLPNEKEGEKKAAALPDGLAVWGEATYWPTQGLPIDSDVHDYFDFDDPVKLVDAEHVFYPRFEPELYEEGDGFIIYRDLDGVVRKFLKKESVIPSPISWPIHNRKDWETVKDERVRFDSITKRLPDNWKCLAQDYQKRSYPLAIGGYPSGLFGLQAHLMGYEHLFLNYYDDPEMIHDMNNTFTNIWICLWEEILASTSVDVLHIFEDVSSGHGSMVSPEIIKEFMLPYYKRITSFLKGRGVELILLDTDGNCEKLIPIYLEGGITGLYPMETETGMDLLKIRKHYPDLQMMGGIPKMEIGKGKKQIDNALATAKMLLSSGKYIPFLDHSVPPNVGWEDFKYYREKLNTLLDYSAERQSGV